MTFTPRILIVDDEPQICASLEVLLRRQGYDIKTAQSGRQALQLMASTGFDLLLLDMVIPDMSGFEIMDHINSQQYEFHTIVITGNASIESAVQALKKGAYDYLKKPFEYEELIKRVSNALDQRRLSREKQIINGKLERSEERYQYLVQHSPDIIYMLDAEGNFTFVNVTVTPLLGFSPEELRGKHFTCIVHADDAARAARFLAQWQQDPRTTGSIELTLRCSRDTSIFKRFEIGHTPIDAAHGDDAAQASRIYGVGRDITYRKQLEDQLQHAKKMEAIYTLAGGIAHDFNNILQGIKGPASLLMTGPGDRLADVSKIETILQHVESGAALTRQLLGFARGHASNVKAADLNEIVAKTTSMFERTNKSIAIHYELQPDLWAVEVDEGQMEQVLLNLYVNAWQAMPDGGELHLITGNLPRDAACDDQPDAMAGDQVSLMVRDTGIGMDPATQQRVFEPFFTTKEVGKGTGLGLASAYGIIKSHGGTMRVQSVKGAGTTFIICLPASHKPITKEQAPEPDIVYGTGTILLVDDEDAMIDVGVEILETLGYKALPARSGREALQVYARQGSAIDLVIIDLIMPEMRGSELFEKLRALDPTARVLLSSGYSIDGEASTIMQRGCNGFIQKPFGVRELSQSIRNILDPQKTVSAGPQQA